MKERTVGYILLCTGIVIMAVSVYCVFLLFTHRIQPFQVFNENALHTEQPQISPQDLLTNPSAITELQTSIMTQIIEKQANKTLNIGSTTLLMYFIMLLGFRVSTLGVQLIRPIEVKLRMKEKQE